MGSASTLGVSGAAAGSGFGARPELGNWLPPPSDLGPACPAPLAAGVTTKRWDMVAGAPDPASWFPGAGKSAELEPGRWGRGRGPGLRGEGGGGAAVGAGLALGKSPPQGPSAVKDTEGAMAWRGRRGPGGERGGGTSTTRSEAGGAVTGERGAFPA